MWDALAKEASEFEAFDRGKSKHEERPGSYASPGALYAL